jgi:hypothetical protein
MPALPADVRHLIFEQGDGMLRGTASKRPSPCAKLLRILSIIGLGYA